MSLDQNHMWLTQLGTVTVRSVPLTGGLRIFVEGFGADGASCRDVAALAMVWAIGELQRELMRTLEKPGGSGAVGVD